MSREDMGTIDNDGREISLFFIIKKRNINLLLMFDSILKKVGFKIMKPFSIDVFYKKI